ncbi:MAG: hypothetical protein U0792_07665 [Gemmataceae bacterium]
MLCELFNTETTGNLKSLIHEGRPAASENRKGDRWAVAEGPVLAGAIHPNERKSDHRDRRGWPATIQGGQNLGWRKSGQAAAALRVAELQVAKARRWPRLDRRANQQHVPRHGRAQRKVADAKDRRLILLNVPLAYRNNHYRFLLVARQGATLPATNDDLYRKKLEAELLEPETALVAAIKLEALGSTSMRALRVGLESPSPWVRFAAGRRPIWGKRMERLNSPSSPRLTRPCRPPALKALASMDDAACTDRLVELTASSDTTLRYGAFIRTAACR